jgi:hypothetical protein
MKPDLDKLANNGKVVYDMPDMCECCQGTFLSTNVDFVCTDGSPFSQDLAIRVKKCGCGLLEEEDKPTTPEENPQHGQNGGRALAGCEPTGRLEQKTITDVPFEVTFIRRTYLEDQGITAFEYSVRVREENVSVALDSWAMEVSGCNPVNLRLNAANQEYQEQDADSCLGASVKFTRDVSVGDNAAFDLEISGNVCLAQGMNYAVLGPRRYALGLIPGPDCSKSCDNLDA